MISELSQHIACRPLIMDGGMGTMISSKLPATERGEDLVLRRPDVIQSIHEEYIKAGADVIITATFGTNSIALADHGLAEMSRELTAKCVQIARAATQASKKKIFIAGELGPTSKLPTLGHISFDAMFAAYLEQAEVIIENGVDAFMLSTCQDPMQVRIALAAARSAQKKAGRSLPIIASVTLEKNGKMLLGTELSAALSVAAPFRPVAFGLNCATGPEAMEEHLEMLSKESPISICCKPNGGMPEIENGSTVYRMKPEDFGEVLSTYAQKYRIALSGGCCGTTPEHIACLAQKIEKKKFIPYLRGRKQLSAVSSLYESIPLAQEPRPFIVAEQTNVNGSKAFRNLLEANDWNAMTGAAREAAKGSHALDVCLAIPARDEPTDFAKFASMLSSKVGCAIMVDSTQPEAIDAALKNITGRSIINSINLEDGGERAKRILEIAAKHGAAVVALCIDEDGMAMTADKKFDVAERLIALARSFGIVADDMLIDCLTFSLASGDKDTKSSATETLHALALVKKELGAKTMLGVSNVSFGLPPAGRKILTSVYLNKAIEEGLDAAIINPKRILPLDSIYEEARVLCERIVDNDNSAGDALTNFLHYLEKTSPRDISHRSSIAESLLPEDMLREKIMTGVREGLSGIIEDLVLRIPPREVINRILMPAMQEVGRRFGEGRLALPFVLESAETMRAAIDIVSTYMKGASDESAATLVLATVRGDVHDIGKNLVDAIISNNGFKVINLGIRQPAQAIIEAAKANKADAIGLSGLIVNSVHVMKEDLAVFRESGLSIPVLCGGAALTKKYTKEVLEPAYGSRIYYCEDAFSGLVAMQEVAEGKKVRTR